MSQTVDAFIAQLADARREIASYTLRNSQDDADGSATDGLNRIRRSATDDLDRLEKEVADAIPGTGQDHIASENAWFIWRVIGRHGELLSQLDQVPFSVSLIEDHGAVMDIAINTRDNVKIPAALGALKADIDAAVNVIQAVMADRMRALKPSETESRRHIQGLQNDYLKQAFGIAAVGLETNEPSRIKFAQDDLTRLKNLFVLREAGVVKNAYVVRLARWAAIATVIFLVLYYLVRTRTVCGGRLVDDSLCACFYDLRNFALLAAGTAVGTCLSFYLRNQQLGFADLAVLEPDRLNPSARIWFMVGLSTLVGLLLFTGAVIAGVGTVTGAVGMQQHGTWAAALGLLAGVAERGLGSAVSRRGADFAAAIGGSQRQDAVAKV